MSAAGVAVVAAPTGGEGDPAAGERTGSGPRSGRWGFGHVPALDGLRGLAVAAVLLYHAGYLDGGYLGVDLFFVLSGFLITSLLLAERETTGRVDLGGFWVRRIRRLLPAVLLLLVGIAVYAVVIARPVDLGDIRADGLATLLYAANWHTILGGSSYWDLSLSPSPLQHTWSLAIEEQFYLVWPIVVVLLARWRAGNPRQAVGRVSLVLAGVSTALFLGLHQVGVSETRVYEGTDTRATALLLGAALAAYRPVLGRRILARERDTAGVVAGGLLLVLWVTLDGESAWLYRGALPLASFLAVVVVAAVCDPRQGPLGRALSVAPLRGLGLISYGLYLWHWPVYLVIDRRNGEFPLLGDIHLDGLALLALKLAVSLAIALISYRLVEQPIRYGRLERRTALTAAVGGMAVVAIVLVAATAGAVDPIGPGGEDDQATGRVGGAPTVMFVGDSVALSIVRPIVEDPGRYGINPLNQARIGCTVVGAHHDLKDIGRRPMERPLCSNLARVPGYPEPDAVFLHIGARPNDFLVVDGREVRACDPTYDRIYETEIRNLLRSIAPDGRPSVVGSIPRSGKYALRIEGDNDRVACVNRVLARAVAAVPGAHLLDMDALVCPKPDACREEVDGHPFRSDGIHYDPGPGAELTARWVVDRVLETTGVGEGG